MAIIHIYGARAILLLFYDHQDNESESTNINTEKISKTIWDNNIHTPQYGWKIVVVIHIHGARAIFLLFCDHQDTESESQGMETGVVGPICTYKYQIPHGTMISIPHNMGEKYCGNYSYSWSYCMVEKSDH